MTKKQRHQMFQDVIDHWTRLYMGENEDGEQANSWSCAFCDAFLWDANCDGCPVQKHTGKSECNGTPYSKAYIQIRRGNHHSPEVLAELEFLKSLRPPEMKCFGW